MIASSRDWRGAMLAKLRRLIHEADPKITEEVKWRRPGNRRGAAVFDHNGIVCIGVLLKERVRLVLGRGASLPDPHGLFNAQLEGNKSRAIDFFETDTLKAAPLKALIRAGVEYNVTGGKPSGKRKRRSISTTVVPPAHARDRRR
jgi:hypothetical protein